MSSIQPQRFLLSPHNDGNDIFKKSEFLGTLENSEDLKTLGCYFTVTAIEWSWVLSILHGGGSLYIPGPISIWGFNPWEKPSSSFPWSLKDLNVGSVSFLQASSPFPTTTILIYSTNIYWVPACSGSSLVQGTESAVNFVFLINAHSSYQTSSLSRSRMR